MKKFKIVLPEIIETPEERKAKERRFLNENLEYAKTLIFLYINNPSTATEITDAMSNYYKKPHDRTTGYKRLKDLTQRGYINIMPSDVAVTSTSPDQIKREVRNKYYKFIESIPDHFRVRYRRVYYFYVNDYGLQFIEWCCKILNFKMENSKDEE